MIAKKTEFCLTNQKTHTHSHYYPFVGPPYWPWPRGHLVLTWGWIELCPPQ